MQRENDIQITVKNNFAIFKTLLRDSSTQPFIDSPREKAAKFVPEQTL
jgi:hypothetical protein